MKRFYIGEEVLGGKGQMVVHPLFKDEVNAKTIEQVLRGQGARAQGKVIKTFQGNFGEHMHVVFEDGSNVMLFGLGEKAFYTEYFSLIKAFGLLGRILFSKNIASFDVVIRSHLYSWFDDPVAVTTQIAKGLSGGYYKFRPYLSNFPLTELKGVGLLCDDARLVTILKKHIDEINDIVYWMEYSKNLSNEHSTQLTPQTFVKTISKTAEELGFSVTVFDRKKLEHEGFGGIVAVGKGSCHDPYLIQLEYLPKKNEPPVVIIGKSVTFDSGGISIKPRDAMDEMKHDMGGGAMASAGVFLTKSRAIKKNVVVLLPVVENMPSHTSYKPGDIIKIYGGKTVEVLDTDAEGRIILADAIEYAKKYKPRAIITMATLTGAVIIALGNWMAGLFSNNKKITEVINRASKVAGERVWELPIVDEHREQLKSTIADIKNIGGRSAGVITAAAFLEFFAKPEPLIHFDIAGTAFYSQDTVWQEKGATGYGVELLYRFISLL